MPSPTAEFNPASWGAVRLGRWLATWRTSAPASWSAGDVGREWLLDWQHGRTTERPLSRSTIRHMLRDGAEIFLIEEAGQGRDGSYQYRFLGSPAPPNGRDENGRDEFMRLAGEMYDLLRRS